MLKNLFVWLNALLWIVALATVVNDFVSNETCDVPIFFSELFRA
jgi:hypothetical protein